LYITDTLKTFLDVGAFGHVFSCDNPRFPKTMAMKIIRIDNMNTEGARSLDAELRDGIPLGGKSRFLVLIVEYFVENGCCFLIMEYCSGGDLQKIFMKNKEQGVKMSRFVCLLLCCIGLFLIKFYYLNLLFLLIDFCKIIYKKDIIIKFYLTIELSSTDDTNSRGIEDIT
jgi:serine/threonine protein kinase